MGNIKSLNKWANAHTYLSIDVLRIALGVFLFIQGVHFAADSQLLVNLIKPFQNYGGAMLTIHYVAPAHFLGGLLIVFGLLTRWAIVAQLPILVVAILLNFIGEMQSNNLLLEMVTLLVCLFFLFYGSGKHSVDYYLKMQK